MNFKFPKFLSLIFFTLLFLSLAYPTFAEGSSGGSEGGGNAQTPVQVVVQIVVAAVVLKILGRFKLP